MLRTDPGDGLRHAYGWRVAHSGRVRRNAVVDDLAPALEQLQPDRTRELVLRKRDDSVCRFMRRRVPESVFDELGVRTGEWPCGDQLAGRVCLPPEGGVGLF